MTPRTHKIRRVKSVVEKIWVNPNSHTLENHYKFLRRILRVEYNSLQNLSDELLEDLCQTIVFSDRLLRRKRQGNQDKLKAKLVKSFLGELHA